MASNPKEFETATDHYVLTDTLGEGGSGRVFRVADASGKPFALKVLRPTQATGTRRRRFRNELGFLRKNKHPNIVTVLDDGVVRWEGANAPFYVMPLYVGTLRDELDRGVEPDKALRGFSQMLDGVEAAHLPGIIHRDLKPENVLVDSEGNYAIADFGISRFEDAELLTAVETQSHERLANFTYAAPEQRVKAREVGVPADLYALGLMLNEMYTGEVIQGTGFKRIAAVSQAHAYLDDIVERLVQQDPQARYHSIDELKKELIGRRNSFVARQELDSARAQAVQRSAPGVVSPVTLVGADWRDGLLYLDLNRAPESGWIQRFKQPREGHQAVMGAAPINFNFQGSQVTIGIEGRNAQQVVNLFKHYLEMATRGYQQDLKQESANREEQERRVLESEIRAATERLQVMSNLKI